MNKKALNLADNLLLFFEFINDAQEIIFIIEDESKTIQFANNKAVQMLGFNKEEFINKPLCDLLSDLNLKELGVDKIRQEDNLGSYSLLTTKNHQSLYTRTSYKNHKHEGISYTIVISRDITEKIKKEIVLSHKIEANEKALEEQKIFSDTLINNAPVAIFYKDNKGRYLGANKAWEGLTGLKINDIKGKSVFDIAPKEIAQVYYEQDNRVYSLEENPQVYQWKIKNPKQNRTFDVMFYKSAYFDHDNNVIGLIGIAIDITDINQLKQEKEEKERLIYHQSKMAAMGEMLENIAHQWRQPLSIITTAASGLQLQQRFDRMTEEQLEQSIENIVEASQYLSHTIDDFRYFFKTDKQQNEFCVKELFERTLKLLSSKFVNHDLILVSKIEPCTIYTFENELSHVILNILNNAADVLNQSEKEKKIIQIECKCKSGQFVIEIQDSGGGVPNDIISRIFEPYFTTKHQSQGTGIGLYMSQEIVKKHLKGTLEVTNKDFEYDNQIYHGALFTITLFQQEPVLDYNI